MVLFFEHKLSVRKISVFGAAQSAPTQQILSHPGISCRRPLANVDLMGFLPCIKQAPRFLFKLAQQIIWAKKEVPITIDQEQTGERLQAINFSYEEKLRATSTDRIS
jgi:hypothetical protein